ncbi:hypothetical protein AB7M49_004500 [Bradyrhizobium elkanii]|jgi:hypothetical protein|uniref:Uncharacterized protein n=1 Tax=Bradyrhizobium elkanii TaxID=29448 RepID=A0A8I2C8V4_BRAEL|nr:hypothetical protein [Bradyrhizobium elkanii]MCS4007049.1 hypothetical protein [Bradyrhizobium elkanii USDA 61]MCP1755947.1 hypothetical protein [Bradyrhizobium elkanii]MCP1929622.1 hypothetical protein [Bradyrhizobium elkanii]MCP1971820.1 hypothetical protein [Bradyrhizobium elkanii]
MCSQNVALNCETCETAATSCVPSASDRAAHFLFALSSDAGSGSLSRSQILGIARPMTKIAVLDGRRRRYRRCRISSWGQHGPVCLNAALAFTSELRKLPDDTVKLLGEILPVGRRILDGPVNVPMLPFRLN